MEITESLKESDSPAHTLAKLGSEHSSARKHTGKLDEGAGSKSSGTYAKQC